MCVLCRIDYGGKIRLVRFVKRISLYVGLSFGAMCWKMANVGWHQEKCSRLSVGQHRTTFVSSGGSWGLPTIFQGMSKKHASIATPLIEMLKNLLKHKNWTRIGLSWNSSAHEAFLKLKGAITDIVPL